jgi:Trypsin-co-occurring domain 1
MPQQYLFDYEDKPILVEVTALPAAAEDDDQAGVQYANRLTEALKAGAQAAGKGILETTDASVIQAFLTIYKMGQNTGWLIDSLYHNPDNIDQSSLAKVEIEFGLKFNGKAETVVTLGGEASINVRLTWEPKFKPNPPEFKP